jgi:hypothetical protein
MATALQLDDTVTTCDCCGKSGLKRTVLMRLDDDSLVNFGTTCAARNTGKTSKQVRQEVFAEEARQANQARTLAHRQEALAAFFNGGHGCPALVIERRNFHATGGQPVNGPFGAWLEARAKG